MPPVPIHARTFFRIPVRIDPTRLGRYGRRIADAAGTGVARATPPEPSLTIAQADSAASYSAIDRHSVKDRAYRLFRVRAVRDLHHAVRRQWVGPFAVLHDPVIALEIQACDVVLGRRYVQIDRPIGARDVACDRVQNGLDRVLLHEQHRNFICPESAFADRLCDPPCVPARHLGPSLNVIDEGIQPASHSAFTFSGSSVLSLASPVAIAWPSARRAQPAL
jgi:hypothetical protein